eukprot:7995926-Pyramimonas_sp.AAC.1
MAWQVLHAIAQRVAALARYPETAARWRHLHLPAPRIRDCVNPGTRAFLFPRRWRRNASPNARRGFKLAYATYVHSTRVSAQ